MTRGAAASAVGLIGNGVAFLIFLSCASSDARSHPPRMAVIPARPGGSLPDQPFPGLCGIEGRRRFLTSQ